MLDQINWEKSGPLLPAIIQDVDTNLVLMLGYMNKQSLQKTLKTKQVWFYSRRKKRLWMKGETSGHILKVVDVKADCDDDTLLIKAKPHGPTCHRGTVSCFVETSQRDVSTDVDFLNNLFETIKNRQKIRLKNSYTASLFRAGLDKICLKVAEESGEVIKAAQKETRQRLIEESSDVIYHLFVLLAHKKIILAEVEKELRKRQS